MELAGLYFRGERIRTFPVGHRPLEVGRAADCDVVVEDEDVAERQWLLLVRDGGLRVVELSGRGESRPFRLGERLSVGRSHELVRLVPSGPSRTCEPSTQPVSGLGLAGEPLGIVVGPGREARRVSIRDRPVLVGFAAECDLVLYDRAVSGRHCRLEPHAGGLFVRDLGSRNGTWVDGVRVVCARVGRGSVIRVGRTDLRVVGRGASGSPGEMSGSPGQMIAASPQLQRIVEEIPRLAKLPWPVLVRGESGVGKEGIARALHDCGPRKGGPFVAVNAGGLPRELVESELFGHEKGAFTGAQALRRGVFEQAHGGTLFLDEIGELPLELQSRLLRVLETWEVRRVGGESTVRVDVRLVCATHRDLRAEVLRGTFREDLYYRIARLVVSVPPLRERPEDVRALAEHFLSANEEVVPLRALSADAMTQLLAYPWPGNVRELRNVVSAAAAAASSEVIDTEDVSRALGLLAGPGTERPPANDASLRHAVSLHRGNLSATARTLGIPRSTLRDRLRSRG